MRFTGFVRGIGLAMGMACALALGVGAVRTAEAQTGATSRLEQGFINPPDSARPHTWWHWVNGNITKEGITRDLEEMKRVGIGGAQIFDVAVGVPAGPVKYNTPEWRALIRHAAREAERLGLELCLHNCAGWSSSGGPWIQPQHAMQMVVVSEQRLKGPTRFQGVLPQPLTRKDYYRDIAVLAFRTPEAEQVTMADLAPKVTTATANFDGTRLMDGDPDNYAWVFSNTRDSGPWLLMEFPRPFTARTLVMSARPGRNGGRGELQVSDDGVTFRAVASFAVPANEPTPVTTSVNFEPVSSRFYRVVFARTNRGAAGVSVAEARLESGYRIGRVGQKAGYARSGDLSPDKGAIPPAFAVARTDIKDLTAHLDASGKLTWEVPEGNWTILRFGHTPTGKENHPASPDGRGLECDKLSREAAEAHWDGMLAKVLADLGPLAGKGLKHVLVDSYEVGGQNWTPRFREEFRARRGYDPLPYLPAMTGRVVESVEATERFLWDLRRTIADLFADNYFGHFATMSHRHGLQLSVEPYGDGGFDNLIAGGRGDIPMSEFWSGRGTDNSGSKLAASVAHTYGKKYVGAEAFTADEERGRWQNHPYALKMLGDLIYTGGVNRFIFHRYAHQPWVDRAPGMTMGPWGFHFERTITWWDQSPAWLRYLARCQYLLQEGRFVADLCYLVSENSPSGLPGRSGLRPTPPAGYDYDGCSPEVLLTRMAVKDGRLVLPDGMSYRVLVLPQGETMTPALLRKVRDLVRDGATVIGPKPQHSPGLQDYPRCDAEVKALADEVWGPCNGTTVTEHAFGKGTVIWGQPLEEVLSHRGIGPDFEYQTASGAGKLATIHRVIDGADVYFVSHQMRQPQAYECSFRVSGRVPELWHPETGRMERAPVYRQAGDRTVVSLRLEPAQSVFVVFRKAAAPGGLVAFRRNGQSVFQPKRLSAKLEIRKAIYGDLSPAALPWVDVTKEVAALVRDGALSVVAGNALAGDPAQNVPKRLRVEYVLNGKAGTATVEENQTLKLPAEGAAPAGALQIRKAIYGVLTDKEETAASRTLDLTEKLASLVRNGSVSVAVGNALAGSDPVPFTPKQLRVEYVVNGQAYTRTIGEHETLTLPDGSEEVLAATVAPAAEVALSETGVPTLTAWEAGAYELADVSGKALWARVTSVPAPLTVAGPWEVRFPAGWGAPASATFPKLISWPESETPGIRYFSGTATYVKEVEIPAEWLRPGTTLLLDLGMVREIATVRVNGQDLGVLWKPPFRLPISGVVRPGKNRLEIQVTNLWPNRLIGDAQLPDDCAWNTNGSLKAWPEWLTAGKPRPANGRFAFTTWKHWGKDAELLPSGLLGPVLVRVGHTETLAR